MADIRAEVKAVLPEVTSYAAMTDDGSLKIETTWMEAPDVERLAHALLRAAKIMRGSRFVALKCNECDAIVDLEFTSRVPDSLSLRHEPEGRPHGVVTWATTTPESHMLTAFVPRAARG